MKFQQITENKTGEIVATIFRSKDENNWHIEAYHLSKTITREEGLKMKNEFGMDPFSSSGVSLGYRGIVPKSVFTGGQEMIF